MPILETINTDDPQYQTALTSFRQVRNLMRSRFKHYFRMTEAQKRAWRRRDPLLHEMISFAEHIEGMEEE